MFFNKQHFIKVYTILDIHISIGNIEYLIMFKLILNLKPKT